MFKYVWKSILVTIVAKLLRNVKQKNALATKMFRCELTRQGSFLSSKCTFFENIIQKLNVVKQKCIEDKRWDV